MSASSKTFILPTDDGEEIFLGRILEQLQYGGDEAVGPGQSPRGEDGEEGRIYRIRDRNILFNISPYCCVL